MEIEKKPQTKKEWKTPELIVLVRSRPEEAVLSNCKLNTPDLFSGVGPSGVNPQCFAGTLPCTACSIAPEPPGS